MLHRFFMRLSQLRDEAGQGLVEYALILSLVSIISIGVLTVLGVDVKDVFEAIETALDKTNDANS
jgi:pilus assembly protein Flp/PilA